MSKKTIMLAVLAIGPWVAASAQSDVKSRVDSSLKAMGAQDVRTLVIAGGGYSSAVGQAFNPHSSWWRRFSNKNYVRSIDFLAKGWRVQAVVGEGEDPPSGGAGRVTPSPDETLDVVSRVGQPSTGARLRGQGIEARAPAFANEVEYLLLPVGFQRTSLERSATLTSETVSGKRYDVVSFPIENTARNGAFKTLVKGWIGEQGYVERVETTIDGGLLGDVVWDAVYTDWKDFGGVKFPTHIVQHQGGKMFFELDVADVKVNVPVDLTPHQEDHEEPPAARGAAATEPEDLGDGVWLVPGGLAGIVAEFKDHLVAIEGPSSDSRAEQIVTQARRLAPNKPFKYVINTHPHFDHAGGLRAFVAEGAAIVTHEGNKGYFEQLFANPHRLVPDTLSKLSPQPKVQVEYVGDKKILTDGARSIEIHRVQKSTHSAFMLMVYLPKQKIVIEADEFNVPGHPPKPPDNLYEVNLLANIDRLNLSVDRIIPIHVPAGNRKVPLDELKKSAGKS